MSRATECFSMNSDMSMRIMASSVSNMNSAKALESSVLPTPVGPRNMNEPIGRCGSDSPAFEHARARDAGPFRDDLCDLDFGDRVAQQLVGLFLDLERLGEPLLQFRN